MFHPTTGSSIHRTRFSRLVFSALILALGLLAGAGRVMAQRPLGVDVSSFQGGAINWALARSGTSPGISFAWTKATEGTTNFYHDADFTVNHINAKANGVLIGAYHFARFDTNPGTNGAIAEAGWFWQIASAFINTNGSYLMPMLDVEASTTGNTKTTISLWVNTWCQTVTNLAWKKGVVVKPVIYCSSSYAVSFLDSTVTQWIPWIADWKTGQNIQTGNPTAGTAPWGTWTVWQYDDTNTTFVGVPASCDVDVFNGTFTQLTNTLMIRTGITPPAAPATNNWDPAFLNASPGSGGAGAWNNSTANWWLRASGDTSWAASGNNAIFAGTAGTVTLTESITVNQLTFTTPGYTIAGATNLLMAAPGNIIVPAGTPTTISAVLGSTAFTLSGGGILVLNNGGNFSQGETIIGPNTTLVVATDHDSGNSSVPLFLQNGGIYQNNDTTAGDQFLLPGCAVLLQTGGGGFDNPNANLTMTNLVTGPGSLTTLGTTFTLTLANTSNNYTGGTTVQSGTLKANASGVLGTNNAPLSVTGGTLNLNAASHTVGLVTVGSGTIQNGTLTGSSYAGQSGTVSAVLAGPGAMTKTTTGLLTLSGANTYTGLNTITAGLVQISSDGNLGAVPGSRVTNQLTFNNGGITAGLRCNATMTLNTNRGINLVGPGGGSLQASAGFTLTYGGIITGSGALGCGSSFNTGFGTVLLSGANNYTGGTTIAAGTLKLGANGALPSGTALTIGADSNTGGGGILDMNGFSQTISALASSVGIGGTGTDTPTIKLTGALTVTEPGISVYGGVIIGSGGSLTVNGPGTLVLAGSNTYSGPTMISSGTLGLAGSINNTSTISIAAGATLQVGDLFSLSTNTTLKAAGTASPASINNNTFGGGETTNVNLASQPIVLTYDGSHPPLIISRGNLILNGNPITVNGPVLAPGVYTMIQLSNGNITSLASLPVSGTAIGAGTTAAISVDSGNVDLLIKGNAAFSNLAANQSIIYGATNVTLGGTLSAVGPTYPANGETVTVTINGNAQTTTIDDATGDFSINYNPSTLLASSNAYAIAYSYAGDAALNPASDATKTLTVNNRPVILTGTRVYDGTATVAASILSVSNIVGSDVVTVASGSGTLAATNVGPEAISSFGTLTLGGPAAGNYTLAGASGLVTITALPTFSITSGTVDASGTNFVITWQSTPGTIYQVLGSTDVTLSLSNWTNIGNAITATDTSTSATNPMTSSTQFFNVKTQ